MAVHWSHSYESQAVSAADVEDTWKAESAIHSQKYYGLCLHDEENAHPRKISSSFWEGVAWKKDQVDHKSSMLSYLHHPWTGITGSFSVWVIGNQSYFYLTNHDPS